MTTRYEQIKNIHKMAVKTHDANELRKIPSLLDDWGFRCREDDGELLWTNLSTPTSIGEMITIGLRYKKKDATLPFEMTRVEIVYEVNTGEWGMKEKSHHLPECVTYLQMDFPEAPLGSHILFIFL